MVANEKPADKRTVFNHKALTRYRQRQTDVVLPRMARPSVFKYLWLLLFLSFLVSGVAWWTPIPIFVSGLGVLTEAGDVVALLPPTQSAQLHSKQTVWFDLSEGQQLMGMLTQIEGNVSATQAQTQLNIDLPATTSSVVIATVILDAPTASLYNGVLYPIQVQVGSQRLFSLFSIK